jgi:4-hydroxybenzoate polyprenyltransferase
MPLNILQCKHYIAPYIALARLDRPVGIWLLLLPCWWGTVMASAGLPDARVMLNFLLGAVLLRSAGCVINDIWDRNIDARTERTRLRPLASGQVSVPSAFILFLVFIFLGFQVLLQFNDRTILLAVLSLPLIIIYPLAKRVLSVPQLVLGITFNWGALLGWSAVTGSLALPAFLLYCACVFWTLAYDTLYACQDRTDDRHGGVGSMALFLGGAVKPWVMVFYGVMGLFLLMIGYLQQMYWPYYIVSALALAAFVRMRVYDLDIDRPVDCLKAFNANVWLGLVILIALFIGKMHGVPLAA